MSPMSVCRRQHRRTSNTTCTRAITISQLHRYAPRTHRGRCRRRWWSRRRCGSAAGGSGSDRGQRMRVNQFVLFRGKGKHCLPACQERRQDRVPFKAPRLVFFVWCKLSTSNTTQSFVWGKIFSAVIYCTPAGLYPSHVLSVKTHACKHHTSCQRTPLPFCVFSGPFQPPPTSSDSSPYAPS